MASATGPHCYGTARRGAERCPSVVLMAVLLAGPLLASCQKGAEEPGPASLAEAAADHEGLPLDQPRLQRIIDDFLSEMEAEWGGTATAGPRRVFDDCVQVLFHLRDRPVPEHLERTTPAHVWTDPERERLRPNLDGPLTGYVVVDYTHTTPSRTSKSWCLRASDSGVIVKIY